MGASGWSYFVPHQEDLLTALRDLRRQVFADGDYWWAVKGEPGRRASEYPDHPTTMAELFDDELVQECGTHSILDMSGLVENGEEPQEGWVEPVSAAEALRVAGTERLTREHVPALDGLAVQTWFGRCAVLHDADGTPSEIYFWGFSGD